MHALPVALYTAARVRALDRHAIEQQGIPGFALMTRAAEAALVALRQQWPNARSVRIWCGAGNNAGDGYVLARLAAAAGLAVQTVALVPPEQLTGDAATAWLQWRARGGQALGPGASAAADVEVDALLGTGLDRPLTGPFAAAVASLNEGAAPVVALDIPSGLHADTGAVLGVAVRAALTVTFVALKQGLFTGAGPACIGRLVFDALGVDAAGSGIDASMFRLGEPDLARWLTPRARDSHKGRHGRVLVVGGGTGMPGAVRLAGEAALRAGAGLVTVVTRPAHVAAVVAARPELICHGLDADDEGLARLDGLLAGADVLALGPGLGRDDWARSLWHRATGFAGVRILDADALNLLAEAGALPPGGATVLTPHPGEAARLLGSDTASVQADRPAALDALLGRYAGVVVLKGAGTLVGCPGRVPWLCDRGNPGMASAGTGDVLTGAIAGLAAQLDSPWRAARAGVFAHACAGDRAALEGERGLLAGDLLPGLRACLNP